MMTPHRAPVRLGIAGCGNVLGAYLALAERLHRQGRVEVVAFCGRAPQRAATLAAWPSADFLTDYAALVSRGDVDAIILLTPMRHHAAMAQAALTAGKHVLVEKPMAVNLDEARGLVELARRNGCYYLCAPFTMLSPTFQTIAARLRRGDIGRVVSARGRYGWAGPDWTDWFYKEGGGALFDLGVYTLTTLTGWLGPVRRVAAMLGTAIAERTVAGQPTRVETDDNGQVLLDFGGACFAVLTTGFTIQQYRGPGVELFGTAGTLYLLGDDWDPDGYEIWQNAAGCWQTFKETQPDWPWTDGLRHLVECLEQRTPPLVTPEHACHVLEVMLLAQTASREGRTLAVSSSFCPPTFSGKTALVAAHRVHDRTRSE
jgi:predicted dehydrogenase